VRYLTWVCFILFWGCSNRLSDAELSGKYQLRQNNSIETIELNPDGTYVYRAQTPSSPTRTYSSHWRFDPYQGEPQVSLDNFPQGAPDDPQRPLVGTLLGIKKSWGRIRLYVNYDLNLYYLKQSSMEASSSSR
jgi:hypothetical protein